MSKTPTPAKLLPDPVADARPHRRTFTGEYKAKILAECDAAAESDANVEGGAIGAILRREGLYSSHLTDWRRRRDEGGAAALAPKKRGRPSKSASQRAQEKELEQLKREAAMLQEKLRRAHIIIEAQKKLSSVLDSLREASETTGSDA
jgi:transposase